MLARSHPVDLPERDVRARDVRRHWLARTGLAWLIMMQVMMLAFPGYLRGGPRSDQAQATLEQAIVLMNWAGLILCVPLILYCAWPFWCGAWSDLRRLRAGMDVPVALGIVAAFVPSVVATWTGRGEVYFDSASMFVAFLLAARFLQHRVAADPARDLANPLARALQASADRLAFGFVLVQLLLAVGVGVAWWMQDSSRVVPVVVALLVMSCPCALSMSVPCALAAGRLARTRAARAGAGSPDAAPGSAVRRVARQNLYGSLAWHVLMTPLAAIGLVQPWLAAITMLVSSLAVAANSWRLAGRSSRRRAIVTAGAAECG